MLLTKCLCKQQFAGYLRALKVSWFLQFNINTWNFQIIPQTSFVHIVYLELLFSWYSFNFFGNIVFHEATASVSPSRTRRWLSPLDDWNIKKSYPRALFHEDYQLRGQIILQMTPPMVLVVYFRATWDNF